MRRVLILNILLLAIVAGLVFQIVTLWWWQRAGSGGRGPEGGQGPEGRRAQGRPPPAAAESLDPDRRQGPLRPVADGVPAGTAAAAAPAEPVRPLTLWSCSGVSGGGPEREALVKDQTQPKPQWLRQGEEVGGYKLGRIDPTSIVMVGPGGEETTLVINVEKAKAGQPAAMTGPAGIQPTPTPVAGTTPDAARRHVARGRPDTGGGHQGKIERLRQEARKRRGAARSAVVVGGRVTMVTNSPRGSSPRDRDGRYGSGRAGAQTPVPPAARARPPANGSASLRRSPRRRRHPTTRSC